MNPQNKTEKPEQVENKEVTELTQEDLRWITGGEGEAEYVRNPTATVFRE